MTDPAAQPGLPPVIGVPETLLQVLAAGSPSTIRELVEASGAPRRSVVELLRAAGHRSDGNQTKYSLNEAQLSALRSDLHEIDDRRLQARTRAVDHVTEAFKSWLVDIPKPLRDLDHVQATPDTVLARVLYLIDTFDVGRTRFCFLGDHDLVAPALALAAPQSTIMIADIDDRLLDFEFELFRRLGADATVAFADFRLAIPPAFLGNNDVALTDPPYSDEGVALFVRRCVESIDRESADSRVLVSYAHSRLRPDLGNRVQSAMLRAGVAIDEMLKGFNRYIGAEALGSRSDLYVCQPLPRELGRKADSSARIYTHGAQAQESKPSDLDSSSLDAILKWLAGQTPQLITARGGSRDLEPLSPHKTRRDQLLEKPTRVHGPATVLDLRGLPANTAIHYLIGLGVQRLGSCAVIVDFHESASALSEIKRAVELVGVPAEVVQVAPGAIGVQISAPDPGADVWAELLKHAHGALKNTWREAMIAHRSDAGGDLTKNDARRIMQNSGLGAILDLRLIDLPVAALRELKRQAQAGV